MGKHELGAAGEQKRDYSRRRFVHTFFARPRPLHLLLLVMSAVLGLALVTQVRSQQNDPLESLTEAELVELLGELDARAEALREDEAVLREELEELSSEADQQASAQEAAAKLRQQADIAAGLVPVVGPGIVMGIADQTSALPAQVFVTVLAELRNAGAEAIEVNEVRLTLRSWFAVEEGVMVVDGVALTPPYTWRAIGEPDTLASAIEIRGGAASQLRAFDATVTVQKREQVRIESVAQPFLPEWSEPAADG